MIKQLGVVICVADQLLLKCTFFGNSFTQRCLFQVRVIDNSVFPANGLELPIVMNVEMPGLHFTNETWFSTLFFLFVFALPISLLLLLTWAGTTQANAIGKMILFRLARLLFRIIICSPQKVFPVIYNPLLSRWVIAREKTRRGSQQRC